MSYKCIHVYIISNLKQNHFNFKQKSLKVKTHSVLHRNLFHGTPYNNLYSYNKSQHRHNKSNKEIN